MYEPLPEGASRKENLQVSTAKEMGRGAALKEKIGLTVFD